MGYRKLRTIVINGGRRPQVKRGDVLNVDALCECHATTPRIIVEMLDNGFKDNRNEYAEKAISKK